MKFEKTGQVLFNNFVPHFQDGKALPDGPVVISPDGLFPSLYREGKYYCYCFCIVLSQLHGFFHISLNFWNENGWNSTILLVLFIIFDLVSFSNNRLLCRVRVKNEKFHFGMPLTAKSCSEADI